MLNASDLANMRAEWERVALASTAVLTSPGDPTQHRSRTGGYTDQWTQVWTGPAEIHAMTASEQELAQRLEAVGDWVVTLPWNTPVEANQRITIDGRTYDVTAILEEGTYLTAKRITAVERG